MTMRPSNLGAFAALICLALAGRTAMALVKLDVTPRSATLLSAKNAKWDTVVIETYVYNMGDTTYVNKGRTPLLYLDVRIDTVSAAKHYLAPGDSLESFAGRMIRDTITVLKAPFAIVTWTDPLKSFGPKPAVEELRVSSLYADLHPKRDTVRVPGCPIPTGLERPAYRLPGAGPVATTVYNVIGRPVWIGKLDRGALPMGLSEGVYLVVQGGESRLFRIPSR